MEYSRIIVILLLICAMIPLPGMAFAEEGANAQGQAIAAGTTDQAFEQGSKTSMNGVHVVSLRGSWYEMGRQYGALMRDELTVFQMVMVPETGILWLRVIGGAGWTQIDLSSFLHD